MVIFAVVGIIILVLLIFLFCACKNSSIWSRHEEQQYLEYIKNNKDNKGE
jgi:uncharacterized membrane protein